MAKKISAVFAAPSPEIYKKAASLVSVRSTNYACNAIREAAKIAHPNLTEKKGFKRWTEEHVRQYAKAFNKHPWWQKSLTESNRVLRIKSLSFMADLCKTDTRNF